MLFCLFVGKDFDDLKFFAYRRYDKWHFSLSVCIICGNMKLISHFAKIIALAIFVCQLFEKKYEKYFTFLFSVY